MIMNVITITMIITTIVMAIIMTIILITEARPWLPAFWFGLTACKASPSWITGEWFCEQFVFSLCLYLTSFWLSKPGVVTKWDQSKSELIDISTMWSRAPITLRCQKSIICYLCQRVICIEYLILNIACIPGTILTSFCSIEYWIFNILCLLPGF